MASPQLEKGFVRIANELFERLYQSCLPGREHRAMEFILRVTFGYGRKTAEISSSELGVEIDCDPSDARKLLANLIRRNMLIRVSESSSRKAAEYQINKNWERWKHERKTPWPPLREKVSRGPYPPAKNPSRGVDPPPSGAPIPRRTGRLSPGERGVDPPANSQNLPESIATLDTLKQEDMKTRNTTPLPPQGERGVSGGPKKAASVHQAERWPGKCPPGGWLVRSAISERVPGRFLPREYPNFPFRITPIPEKRPGRPQPPRRVLSGLRVSRFGDGNQALAGGLAGGEHVGIGGVGGWNGI